jgi:cytochrome d ubiquinol oxidase subunit I
MDAVSIARWQFAITTVYHFLFVPITIGLAMIVAGFETAHLRTGNPQLLRMTKFLGKLFVINFALGLATGIVQEFQFGMNWSDYSRFVGDIFGAPLAIEALLAFFLESTFLGLWIFGWGRISPKLHNACMYAVAIGTILSAYFILAANSFMQNPVGYRYNPATKRAELTDFGAVLTNKVQLVTFPHVIAGAFMTAGALVMGVAFWHLRRTNVGDDGPMYRVATKVGAWVTIVASVAVIITGDLQGKIMTQVQPMKMAAAEALYDSVDSNAPFSIFTIGTLNGSREVFSIKIPGLLSFLATGSLSGSVQGINDLQAQYAAQYGGNPLTAADSYAPFIPLTYWSFRLMIGAGMLALLIAIILLIRIRKNRVPRARWLMWVVTLTPLLPLIANSFGWIFTEAGRQPWIVFGVMTTTNGVSPSVPATNVLTSLIIFTLLYGGLAVVEVMLMLRYAKAGADPLPSPAKPKGPSPTGGGGGEGPGDSDQAPDADHADEALVFAY